MCGIYSGFGALASSFLLDVFLSTIAMKMDKDF